MKIFKDKITLIKNNRGCYILDTIKGCLKNCYNDCYAKNIVSRYGFDFSKIIKRDFYRNKEQLYLFNFYDNKHEQQIINQIKNKNVQFVRIGETGDPSLNWKHTINICKIISVANKPIIIITKHLKPIPNYLLKQIKNLKLYINTSISALDDDYEREYRLEQFNKLKNYCNSILRIVSCDFNKKNKIGHLKSIVQDNLFKHEKIIDTVFRPNIKNPLVLNKVIKIKKVKFLNGFVYASIFNKNVYLGNCINCIEKCGINI